jgi:hypothetical protein
MATFLRFWPTRRCANNIKEITWVAKMAAGH